MQNTDGKATQDRNGMASETVTLCRYQINEKNGPYRDGELLRFRCTRQ